MAFLITSPLVNEVAVVLLWGLLGWKLTLWYVVIGITIGILCGWLLDKIRADRWLQPLFRCTEPRSFRAHNQSVERRNPNDTEPASPVCQGRSTRDCQPGVEMGHHRRWCRGWFTRVCSAGWLTDNLGSGQWWSVPAAVLVGIPLYSNATGIIPVMESLLTNGLPLGTTLAFCMSTVAASVPEFVMLKQVMQWRLLALLFGLLLAAFTLIGWLFNLIILL